MDTDSIFKAYVENRKMSGSGWVYNRIGNISIDLYKDATKGGSIYEGLSKKVFQFLASETKMTIYVEVGVYLRTCLQ